MRPKTLLSALLAALALVVAVSAGLNVARATNVGLFGSKNNFGLAVAMMLPVGWAVAVERRQPAAFRLLGVTAMIAAPPLLLAVGLHRCSDLLAGDGDGGVRRAGAVAFGARRARMGRSRC